MNDIDGVDDTCEQAVTEQWEILGMELQEDTIPRRPNLDMVEAGIKKMAFKILKDMIDLAHSIDPEQAYNPKQHYKEFCEMTKEELGIIFSEQEFQDFCKKFHSITS